MAYLTGGYLQEYPNVTSKGTPGETSWGNPMPQTVFLGQGRDGVGDADFGGPFHDGRDAATYSWAYIMDEPVAPALKILGGNQQFYQEPEIVPLFSWGLVSDYRVTVGRSIAWSDALSGWYASRITLYLAEVGDIRPGFSFHGLRFMARDLESKKPFVTVSEWNDDTGADTEQFLGTGMAYTQKYGWGFSQLSIFISPV